MDKTLFLPAMIEAFSLCRRSYLSSMKNYQGKGFSKDSKKSSGLSLFKLFVKKGIAEINRGKVINSNQVQIFSGEYWPLEEMEKQNFSQDQTTRLFLYSYKLLMSYVKKPFRPQGSQIAAVGQKIRAKVPGAKVYLEDTFDLILWYPETKTVEIVDFRLKQSSIANLRSARSYILSRQYLADKLKSRLSFENLVMTTCLMNQNSMQTESITVDQDELNGEAWASVIEDLIQMKSPNFSGSGDLSLIAPCTRNQCVYCNQSAGNDEDVDNTNSSGLCLSA